MGSSAWIARKQRIGNIQQLLHTLINPQLFAALHNPFHLPVPRFQLNKSQSTVAGKFCSVDSTVEGSLLRVSREWLTRQAETPFLAWAPGGLDRVIAFRKKQVHQACKNRSEALRSAGM